MPEQPKDKSENRSKLKAVLASPYFLPAATILPMVIAFLVQRRIRPRATPQAEAIAKNIRESGVGVTVEHGKPGMMNQLRAIMQYGTPHVGEPAKMPGHVETIVHPFPEGDVAGRRAIGNAPLFANSFSKLNEIQHLRATAGGHAAPYSAAALDHVDNALKALPPEARLKVLSQRFAESHRPSGYVVKPQMTFGKTEPLYHTHDLVNEYNNLYKFDFLEPRPEWGELAAITAERAKLPQTSATLASVLPLLRETKDPAILAMMLGGAPAEMQKPLMAYALAHVPETMFVQDYVPAVAEFRMHVLNGRLVPGTTVPRHDKMQAAGALAGFPSSMQQQAENTVQKNVLGRMRPEDLHNRMMSLDVAVKADGTPVILEVNPHTWSGFLTGRGAGTVPAAINMHKWMGELAGQTTLPMAGAQALGAGALGAGAAYGAQRLTDGDQTTET